MTTDNLPEVQWFPGHMKKAQRIIEKHLPLVDIVVELRDARVPSSSSNPLLAKIIKEKPRLIILTKSDLADPRLTKLWLDFFAEQKLTALAVDMQNGQGLKAFTRAAENLARPFTDRLAQKGVKSRAARMMILGIPNVGKSTLINRLAGAAKTKTANTPGVTRAEQWIRVGKSLELLDTPGILWPKFEDKLVGVNLASVGAIRDEVFDTEDIAVELLRKLRVEYADSLKNRFKIAEELPKSERELLELIGKKRGCLLKGGVIDESKAAVLLLTEFRAGRLGRISLEKPISVSSAEGA